MIRQNEFAQFGVAPPAGRFDAVELQLRCLVRFFRAVLAELKSKQGLPWKQRLKAWRYGFSSRTWVLYGLAENDPGQYLDDISSRLGVYKINGFFNPIIGNKLIMSRLAAAHGIPHPTVVSIIINGRLIEESAAAGSDLSQTLDRTLDRYPYQVFRPTWSGGGRGVFFLQRNQDVLKLNGITVTLEEVCSLLSKLDRYMSTVFEVQADYASKIFPHSTNTLRILTLWDYSNDRPFIAAVSHRFGTSRSVPIDNWHQGQGGVCAFVDLASSKLGQAAMTMENLELVWFSSHPETGERIEGVVIPNLSNCLEGMLATANCFPFCPCIGWDVVVTENGYSVLEANSTPDFRVWQVHEGFFANERTRQFFQYWKLAP